MALEPRRRGRPVERAVLDATVTALVEHGYGFSLDDVAKAAGVHKTTVYRRWETKPTLVVAAAQQFADAEITITSTGDATEDLTEIAVAVARALGSRVGGQLLRAVVAAGVDDPELIEVTKTFLAARYAAAADVIRAGQHAGTISPDVDPLLLWQAMVNPLHMSALCGIPLTEATARQLARLVLDGARP